MKLSTDTWHFRNWEYWLDNSISTLSSKYKKQWITKIYSFEYEQYDMSVYQDYILEKVDSGTNIYSKAEFQPNLCAYFWVAVLRSPVLRSSKNLSQWGYDHQGALFLSLITLATLFLGTLVNFVYSDLGAWWHPYLFVAAFFAGVIALFFLCLGLSHLMSEVLWPKIEERRDRKNSQERVQQEKGPSIFVEHLKAKKKKVCPILEFEESNSG